MSNIVPLRAGQAPAIFANRANLPDMNKATQQGLQAGFAVIGTKGRNWRIKYRGEEELIMDGRNPVPSLDVVIVGVSPFVSKNYYEKGFEQDSAEAPDCFSVNGVTPDASAAHKQSPTCAVCPKNLMGSKISDAGKKVKACQDNRRISVVPLGDILNESYGGPMMLRLPYMSLGNLAKYGTEMQRYDAQPFMVGTRLSFDLDVTYQLLEFEALGWLTEEQATMVAKVMEDPLIERMLETEVVEATHDAAAAQAASTSALAGGRPAAAFTPAASTPAATPTPPAPTAATPTAATIDYAAIQAKAQAQVQAQAQAEAAALAEAVAAAEAQALAQAQQAQAQAHAQMQQAQAQMQTPPKKSPGSAFTTGGPAVGPTAASTAPAAIAAVAAAKAAPAQGVPYAPDDLDAAVDDLLAS